MTHYLIIGAGPAGVRAAEELRRQDPDGRITLLDGEGEAPYSRMAIPYFLEGKIGEEGTWLHRPLSWYQEQGMEIIRGRAARVDATAKKVILEDGSSLEWDRLLLATGARPVRPPVEGLGQNHPRIRHCWTLEDARAIAGLAGRGAEVVLMGAGFIGSIILESLVLRGVRLTVVEVEDRMVPRMLDETAGGMLKAWCEKKGVRVLTSTRIERVGEKADGRLEIALSSGETLPADLLVVAAGVTPNIECLADTGVERRTGVIVNARMETSLPDVWAAGDCAEGCDFSTGDLSTLAIQPVAVEQGVIAARNMAGVRAEYHCALPMNVLATLGLITTSFGRHDGLEIGERAVLHDPEHWRYIRLEFHEDRLIGAQTAGHVSMVGCLRGLIQGRVPLKGWKDILLREPHRVAEAYVDLARNPA
jgi:NAD(P)H-nitrite reductase large subunit